MSSGVVSGVLSSFEVIEKYLSQKNVVFHVGVNREAIIKQIAAQACFNLQQPNWIDRKITVEQADTLRKELDSSLVAISQNLRSTPPPESPKKDFGYIFEHLVKATPGSFSKLKHDKSKLREALKEVFIYRSDNSKIMKELRDWIQDELLRASRETEDPALRDCYIHHLLAYYPFFNPPVGDLLQVPQTDGTVVVYRTEKLCLTPEWMGSPLVAYGLKPVDERETASPFLLLKGSTYPTDSGCCLSILSDLTPFGSVGGFAFHLLGAKGVVGQWLKTCSNKPVVLGQSLGGALTLEVAAHFPGAISKAMAFNSPAMSHSVVRAWETNCKDLIERPRVNVILQDGDMVGQVGCQWANDWNVYYSFAMTDTPKGLLAKHSSAFTSRNDAFIYKRPVSVENARLNRRFWVVVQNFLIVPLFAVTLTVFLALTVIHAIINIAKKILCCGKKKAPIVS